jgi:hypothetical protein
MALVCPAINRRGCGCLIADCDWDAGMNLVSTAPSLMKLPFCLLPVSHAKFWLDLASTVSLVQQC